MRKKYIHVSTQKFFENLEEKILQIYDKFIKPEIHIEKNSETVLRAVYFSLKRAIRVRFLEDELVVELSYETDEFDNINEVEKIIDMLINKPYFKKPQVDRSQSHGETTIDIFFEEERDFEMISEIFIYRSSPFGRKVNFFREKTLKHCLFIDDYEKFLENYFKNKKK